MISRRGALLAIATAAFGRLGSLISKGHPLGSSDAAGNFTASGAQLADTRNESLSTALSRLGKRVYSEEGIPMFLACENLEPTQTSTERTPLPSTPLNEKVASAFHHYADEWQRTRPNAPATDVAKIVELLAYRDFAAGGAEQSL